MKYFDLLKSFLIRDCYVEKISEKERKSKIMVKKAKWLVVEYRKQSYDLRKFIKDTGIPVFIELESVDTNRYRYYFFDLGDGYSEIIKRGGLLEDKLEVYYDDVFMYNNFKLFKFIDYEPKKILLKHDNLKKLIENEISVAFAVKSFGFYFNQWEYRVEEKGIGYFFECFILNMPLVYRNGYFEQHFNSKEVINSKFLFKLSEISRKLTEFLSDVKIEKRFVYDDFVINDREILIDNFVSVLKNICKTFFNTDFVLESKKIDEKIKEINEKINDINFKTLYTGVK